MLLQPQIANLLIDIIPDLCFVVSGDGTVLSYNKRARDVLSLPETPGGEISFYSLLSEDSPKPPLSVLKTLDWESDAEVQFKTASGNIVDAILSIKTITGTGREFLYLIARDVSEEKKKELDLLRFSHVVHYTINPIQITDARKRMVYVNPAFEKITGYAQEELIGRDPKMLSSGKHSKSFWKKVWEDISSGNVWMGDVENRRKNGEPLFTQLLISPIVDPTGSVVGYLGAHRDITAQKQLEQQLIHTQKMESMGTLAAGIAHEVGNPLASISSIVQVLQRTMSEPFAREKLAQVQSQVLRINKIIRDLVDFSRPSTYQLCPTDVVKTLLDSVEIVRMGKKAKGVTFSHEIRQQVPLLQLVPDQLSQVFINILLNAVDAIDGKAGRVTSVVEQDGKNVYVTITDTGSGILAEHIPKIFEPFFTTKRVGEGTGLGLWVSYGIVKSFQGDITIESARGVGASFCVTLPLQQGVPHGSVDPHR